MTRTVHLVYGQSVRNDYYVLVVENNVVNRGRILKIDGDLTFVVVVLFRVYLPRLRGRGIMVEVKEVSINMIRVMIMVINQRVNEEDNSTDLKGMTVDINLKVKNLFVAVIDIMTIEMMIIINQPRNSNKNRLNIILIK